MQQLRPSRRRRNARCRPPAMRTACISTRRRTSAPTRRYGQRTADHRDAARHAGGDHRHLHQLPGPFYQPKVGEHVACGRPARHLREFGAGRPHDCEGGCRLSPRRSPAARRPAAFIWTSIGVARCCTSSTHDEQYQPTGVRSASWSAIRTRDYFAVPVFDGVREMPACRCAEASRRIAGELRLDGDVPHGRHRARRATGVRAAFGDRPGAAGRRITAADMDAVSPPTGTWTGPSNLVVFWGRSFGCSR